MSQFTAINLAQVAPPDVIEPLDFEQILAAMLADLLERAPELDAQVESEPFMKVLEVCALDRKSVV